jgi:hypothetical protein
MWDPFDEREPEDPNSWVRAVTVLCATAILAVVITLSVQQRTKAQERGDDGHITGHARHHDEYSHWCQADHPDCMETGKRGQSCCDARVVEPQKEGPPVVSGHCYPTTFKLNPTGETTWIARLAPEDRPAFGDREWVEVPDDKLVNRYKNPDPTGEAGHLCTNNDLGWIMCGREPRTGS